MNDDVVIVDLDENIVVVAAFVIGWKDETTDIIEYDDGCMVIIATTQNIIVMMDNVVELDLRDNDSIFVVV